MQEQIKGEFHVSDAQLGSLTFYFLLTYVLISPFTGWLGDRFPRKPMIVLAALFWCSVNLLTAFVHSFASLNFRHAALGLGEASFGIFAPAMLADFYPPDQRNRVLTLFNIALPVGAALGYLTGGYIGQHYGWRMSFTVSAIPGIVLALLIAAFMREPTRGASTPAPPLSQPPRPRLPPQATPPTSAPMEATPPSPSPSAASPSGCPPSSSASTAAPSPPPPSSWEPSPSPEASSAPSSAAPSPSAGPAPTPPPSTSSPPGAPSPPSSPRSSASSARASSTPPPSPSPRSPSPSSSSSSAPAPSMRPPSTPSQPGIRATALAGQLLAIHALGDACSPTLIGFISDRSNLADGLGSTLLALLLGAAIFFLGARYATSFTPEADPAPQPA